ncbi:MAG: tetratricopeptide repeat protein [Vicinamibacterales bacterium]
MHTIRVVLALAIGCVLASSARAADTVTFSKDVAPIVFQHCTTCHRPGEIGPFSLLSYRDARQRMTLIVDTTSRRVMPPWKAESTPGQYLDDRSLSDAQVRTIRAWADAGGPEGDPKDLPPLPTFTEGWQFGTPDIVVTMPEPYTLRPDGPDLFRTFVLPIPTSTMKYVRGIEFRPGKSRGVHHANIGVDRTRSSRRLDGADPEPGYVGGMVQDAAYPPGYMLGWTPGQLPRPSPEGMPWRLEADSDLIVQLHLQPTGRPEPVQVSIGFFFTDQPPTRTPLGLRMGSETIDIAPGNGTYEILDTFDVPVDAQVLALQPHAHYLGREMFAQATLPDGTTKLLVNIHDWDFRWQDVYRFTQPVELPKGSRISMRFTYDNSAANPRNPYQPPRRIVWGQNTTDEMGDLWVQLVPVKSADLGELAANIAKKTRTEDIAAYTRVLKTDPNNPLRHDAVAMLYMQDGRLREAVDEFRQSLRLNKDSAPTHYNLGIVLSMLRRYPEAMREYEAAVKIDPAHAEAHNNLGAMLHVNGELDQAAVHYRRAIELRPDNTEARANLGRLLMLQGKAAAAATEFEQTIAIQPDAIPALTGLAWIRATSAEASLRRPGQALAMAERARQLSKGQDPQAYDALAAAYAALGVFEQAVTSARLGIQVADAAGQTLLADEMRARLQLYQNRKSFVR